MKKRPGVYTDLKPGNKWSLAEALKKVREFLEEQGITYLNHYHRNTCRKAQKSWERKHRVHR